MEGIWRGSPALWAAVLVALALAGAGGGCGGSDDSTAASPDTVQTGDPARAFAPLVLLAADEPYRPMGARWFVERSVLRLAEEPPCADRTIAVGRTLPELRTGDHDWIFADGLGTGTGYHRNPLDASCEPAFGSVFYADQLTRPHDRGRARAANVPPGAGFYLDLVDAERGGPEPPGDAPVYFDRRDEGGGGVRIAYWMLFGMGAPPSGERSAAHEGDWERVDVLLDDLGDGRYAPRAVQLGISGSTIEPDAIREIPWDQLPREDGTHPRVRAEPGTHRMLPASAGSCPDCVSWQARDTLVNARKQLWYGFGGAWGEPGATEATSGALGPHGGSWPIHE